MICIKNDNKITHGNRIIISINPYLPVIIIALLGTLGKQLHLGGEWKTWIKDLPKAVIGAVLKFEPLTLH